MPLVTITMFSSDGLQKRDIPFWRHCTVRFTRLKVIHVWQSVNIYCAG